MNLRFLLHLSFLLVFITSCSDDVIQIPQGGTQVFLPTLWNLKLQADITTEANVRLNQLGIITCDSIQISFGGFTKDYYFLGVLQSDSSASIDIAPLDSSVSSKLKLEVKQKGTAVIGQLFYCDNLNNCDYVEIGHLTGYYSYRYEGFYYSPLFYGEFFVTALNDNRSSIQLMEKK